MKMRKVNVFLRLLPLFSPGTQLCSHNSSELISSLCISETMHFENTIMPRLFKKKMKEPFQGSK